MRLWSVHPKYLDSKGLVALWREALLAKAVLRGETKGYTQHPQLIRFKAVDQPVERINQYLSEVWLEAERRGYHFNKQKVDWDFRPAKLELTEGQLDYEFRHLLRKLKIRDTDRYRELISVDHAEPHPMFVVVTGEIEHWEILR